MVLLTAMIGAGVVAFVFAVADGGWPELSAIGQSARARITRVYSPPPPIRLARRLRSSNVSRQVDQAIASGRYRLVGISGIVLFFPGMEGHAALERALTRRYGYLYVEGTGDASPDADWAELHTEAYLYAKHYNTLLRQRLFGQ